MKGNSSVRLTEELVRLVASNHPGKWIDFIINRSSIGKLLELEPCNDILELLDRAVSHGLSIDERMFLYAIACRAYVALHVYD